MRIIAIANRKGGSGKTATTVNLAGALAKMRYSCLAIDLDPQGSLTRGLGASPSEVPLSAVLLGGGEGFDAIIQDTAFSSLYLIPSDPDLNGIESGLRDVPGKELRLRRCLSKFMHRQYDFVLVDCPPSLGALTANALVAAHDVIIPVDCGSYGRDALSTTLATIQFTTEEINYNLQVLGILISNVNSRTTYDQMAETALREQFGPLVFTTQIPSSIRVDEAAECRTPIVYYDPGSAISTRYLQVADEVITRTRSQIWPPRPQGEHHA